ncbi:hypothetical protein GGS21DRAFT_7375 [Xylaria nigripes]|nr:hypothetical protein GGS21DRAFT_7375 [Xylaria nigripes]
MPKRHFLSARLTGLDFALPLILILSSTSVIISYQSGPGACAGHTCNLSFHRLPLRSHILWFFPLRTFLLDCLQLLKQCPFVSRALPDRTPSPLTSIALLALVRSITVPDPARYAI